jgi:hypothetical protein
VRSTWHCRSSDFSAAILLSPMSPTPIRSGLFHSREKAELCLRLADGFSFNNPGRLQLFKPAEDFRKRAQELEAQAAQPRQPKLKRHLLKSLGQRAHRPHLRELVDGDERLTLKVRFWLRSSLSCRRVPIAICSEAGFSTG